MSARGLPIVVLLAVCGLFGRQSRAADVRPQQEFVQKASWKLPTADSVREQALAWIAARGADEAMRVQMATLWSSAGEDGKGYLLDLMAATFAAADPHARELLNHCSQPHRPGAMVDVRWLAEDDRAPLEQHNLRLLYGRWLVQESLYDEAQEQLGSLTPQDVVDPAALLFYQAVIHHRTLNRDAGLKAIHCLLERDAEIPKRFNSLARLMQADLEKLKDESLDHIARRMEDIRRRLDLGRAGPKVRAVEDGVIASLDKLIEELEKQQQAAAAAAKAASGGMRPTAPAPDSLPMQGKGAGEVTKKPLGHESGWGDLPPRARQEALQQIGKDFPAHYRDVIEQYFRKLASESDEKPDK